ncbi:MAG: hypothetical protein AAB652_01155 [Patescibacteria group bacterium]
MLTHRFVRNRYLDAFLKLVLLSGLTHIFILLAYYAKNGDLAILNHFNILDLDLFFPGITLTSANNIFPFVILFSVYSGVFFFFTGSRGKKK